MTSAAFLADGARKRAADGRRGYQRSRRSFFLAKNRTARGGASRFSWSGCRGIVDMIASPPRSITDQPAALQLTTKPVGATFAVYPGIIADRAAPASAPLRTGTAPGRAEDLPGGNYTIFFHKDGWPDSRTEVQLQAGEVRPVEYAFFHGEVTITSVPDGAEILCGTVSLGFTPLTVALPAGNHVLTACLKNYPDRTQNVTVNENATPTIEFRMGARRRSATAKPTPPPSLIGKVGASLKHLFGGSPTPPPHKKR